MKAWEVYGEIGLKGLEKVKAGLEDAGKFAKAYEKTSSGVWKKVASLVSTVAITKFAKDSMTAYKDSAAASLKLQNTIARMPQLAGASQAAFEEQAAALQQMTAAEDDAVVAAQSLLGTFGATAEQIEELMPLVVDLARKNLGGDLTAAATAVGKALDGSSGALARAKVSIDKAAYSTDKYTAVQDALSRAVGGFAAQEAESGLVASEQLANSFDDLQEAVGKRLLPKVVSITKASTGVIESFNGMDEGAQDVILGIGGVTTAGLVALPVIARMATALKELGVISGGATAAGLGKAGAAAGVLGGVWAGTTYGLSKGMESLGGKFRDTITDHEDLRTVAWLASLQIEGAANTIDKETAALGGEKAAMEASTDAMDEKVRSMQGYMVAADDLSGVERTLTELELASKTAVLDVKDARQKLTEAIKTSGKGSDEAKRAAINLERAELRAADAAADLKVKQEEYGTTAARLAKDRAMIKRLEDEAAAARNLSGAYKALVAQYGKALAADVARFGGAAASSGIQRKYGGRTAGPEAGYPVTMHGVEWVIPERAGDSEALRLWQEAGRAIGALGGSDGSRAGAASITRETSISTQVYVLADDRFTDMGKLGRFIEQQQRGQVGQGQMMARMGMGG